MIKIRHYDNVLPNSKSIDVNKNMLIIGDGGNNNDLNQIEYYDSSSTVDMIFPDSELSSAFKTAKTIGAPYVFIMNIRTYSDYIDIVDVIRHYDFAYIIPLGVKFSEEFYNSQADRVMTFSEFYLDQIGSYTNSTIIMTDSHASLYEDMDAYLKDMFDKIVKFKFVAQKTLSNGRNLCLVANNLKDYKLSNVVLGSMLCAANNADYPTYNVGDAVFDIDSTDVGDFELAYFKNNYLVDTSVENLKNFRIEDDAAKLIEIDMVIKFIERSMDFSEFRGKTYNEYIRLQIFSLLQQKLEEIRDVMIRDFSINDVTAIRTGSGECDILNDFNIIPINGIEEFNIIMEV